MLILESKRGSSRQNFDFPALEKTHLWDITPYVALHFGNVVGKGIKNRFETVLSDKITEDSKFFTLDRRIPSELVPDVAKCMRNDKMTPELASFIKEVVDVQAKNLLEIVAPQGQARESILEFQPGDSLDSVGRVAVPLYAYIRREGEDGLILETETAFRVYTPEPKVEAADPEPRQE